MKTRFSVPSCSVFHPLRLLGAATLLTSALGLQAGVDSYGAFKGKEYAQTAGGVAPSESESHGLFTFVHTAAEDELFVATLLTPGAQFPVALSPDDDDPLNWIHEVHFETLAQLNAGAPNGNYQFSLIDSDINQLSGSLSVTGDAYPPGTGLNNFAVAQQIDATKSFTLQWTPPAGLGAGDYVAVRIQNDQGDLLATSFPWQPGPLPGTTSSYEIPAGTLNGQNLELNLVFIHVAARNTTSIEGATGISGYYSSTSIPMKLAGGGGGGDTTAPTLVSSAPASGAIGMVTDTTLVLTFSEPMQPTQMVNWVNVPNSGSINYTWSNGGQALICTLPGGFPANTTIIWALTPTSFKDLAGNSLGGNFLGGFFTTKSNTPEPCTDGPANRSNFFLVSKEVSYVQTSAADPVEGGNPVGTFGSFFSPAQGTTVTAASVRLPNGNVTNLTSVLGRYFLSASTASEVALNTAYPAGTYTGIVTIGGQTGNLALPMVAAPGVPKCLNYAAAQQVDATAAFTLQWNAFTGATGNDRLEIEITDSQDATVYHAPDECAQPPVTLAPTATSVTLGANLLQPGKTYNVELRFRKISAFATQGSPAYQGATAFSKVLRHTLKTTGGVVSQLKIKAFRLPADSRFEVDVEAGASQTVFLDAWVNFTTWEPVNGAVTTAAGLATLKDQRLQVPNSQVYRVRTQ